MLFGHYRNWLILDGASGLELLPETRNVSVEAGINGTDEHGNPAAMAQSMVVAGFFLIDQSLATPSDTPDRQAGYVRRTRVKRGYFYHTAWESVRVVGGLPTVQRDEAGYFSWLRRLLATGKIEPADPSVIEALLAKAQERLDRASSRDTERNTIAARLAEQAAKQVDQLKKLQEQRSTRSLAQIQDRAQYLREELARLESENV